MLPEVDTIAPDPAVVCLLFGSMLQARTVYRINRAELNLSENLLGIHGYKCPVTTALSELSAVVDDDIRNKGV